MGRQGEAFVQSVHQACFHCQHEGLFLNSQNMQHKVRCSFLNFYDLLLLTSGRRCFKLVFRGRMPPCPPVEGFVLFGPEFKSTKLCNRRLAVGFLYAIVFIFCPRAVFVLATLKFPNESAERTGF